MSAKTTATLVLFLLLPVIAQADSGADENSQLRAEIAALKARNETLERACPAAASANAPAAPAVTAVTPVTAPTASAATAVATPAVPLAPSTAAAPVLASAPIVEAAPAKPSRLYADTGCDRGFFTGPARGKWQDPKAWKKISNGMTMAEVENVIGVEHYDEEKGSAVQWQYGRCASSWESSVKFVNGVVVTISPP